MVFGQMEWRASERKEDWGRGGDALMKIIALLL